ncbi:MAG: hypothetical protein GVY26_19475 [Bacteroidetes bacterium]|jgi:hypothetical protein|nr:hypothetical protein [Bacteroidota bacterium]
MITHYDAEEDEQHACGCPIPNDKRKPAGCIQVEDVQMNNMMLGVEDVKVTWWNGWFTFKTTSTDGAGCWSIDRHRERGKAYMWVTFQNSRAMLRGFVGNTAKLWRLLLPVTDYRGQLGGGSYHNIQIDYNMWNNQGGSDHRTWSASTVMNGIHHFHREAQNDGINTPPSGLDIYLTANRRDGIALMTSQLPQQTVNDLVGQGLFSSGLLPYIISNNSILAAVPDVAIGCNFQNSDQQWSVTQHELAHTSHFTNAGAIFWGRLGLATLNARIATGDPWGDEDVFDAGILAICESWAEHLEHVYTDRAYNGFPTSINEPWVDRLDRWRNDSPNHVPIGIHLDLFDNMEPPLSFDREGGGSGLVVDNVTGLTNGQLFSVLDAATDDPQEYRQRIINDLLPGSGIAVGDVDALFNSY